MLRFNRHRRFQERLSAYMDGELAPREARTLETHLESCESCGDELAALRLASVALRELPDVDVPRSFALRPADVARPPTPVAAGVAHSLNSGLRLTGAGLAAALALVLVLDVGGVVGGMETGDSDDQSAAIQFAGFAADATQEGSKTADSTDALTEDVDVGSGSNDAHFATEAPALEAGGMPLESPIEGAGIGRPSGNRSAGEPSDEPAGTPFSTSVSGSPAGESPAASTQVLPASGGEGDGTQAPANERAASAAPDATPTPTATLAPSDPAADADAVLGLNGFEEEDNGTLSVSESNLDPEDGPSALLLVEVVLAVLLGLSASGIIAATFVERRRR